MKLFAIFLKSLSKVYEKNVHKPRIRLENLG